MTMKRYFHFLSLCFLCCFIHSVLRAEPYRVAVHSTLNVRPAPTMVTPAIGSLDNNEQIDVIEIKKGWAKIDYKGKEGYVHSKYIRPVTQNQEIPPVTSTPLELHLILSVVGLCVISWVIRQIIKKEEILTKTYHTINLTIWLTIFGLELYYFFGIGGDIWFCYPDHVGWLKTIIHFFVFGFIVYHQILSYVTTLFEMQYNGARRRIDYRFGKYSAIGLLLFSLVSLIYDTQYIAYIALAFIIAQLIQIGIILQAHGRCVFSGIVNVIFYMAGAVATLWTVANFLYLLIIVLIALLMLSFIGSTANNPSEKDNY